MHLKKNETRNFFLRVKIETNFTAAIPWKFKIGVPFHHQVQVVQLSRTCILEQSQLIGLKSDSNPNLPLGISGCPFKL